MTSGVRLLCNGAEAALKLKIEGRASFAPSSNKIGTASFRAALTSSLNISLVVLRVVNEMAAVRFAVAICALSLAPGTGMPRMSSTARTVLTKFFWTVGASVLQ